jgi:hypothetical protein
LVSDVTTTVRPPPTVARLVEYKSWPQANSALIGHATVDFGGWIVCEIPVFRRGDGGLSTAGPSAASVDKDGRQKTLPNGKREYWAAIRFEGDGKERWERAVLGALAAAGVTP